MLSWLRDLSSIGAAKRCMTPRKREVMVAVDGAIAHVSGVARCASPWVCPMCGPTIREGRAVEIDKAVRRHLDGGGGCVMLTCTLPHDAKDPLAITLKTVLASYRNVWMNRLGMNAKATFGIVGQIKAVEVTYGRSGWHPHVHALVLTAAPLSTSERRQLRGHVAGVWARSVVQAGFRRPGARVGVDVMRVDRAADVAQYLTKVDGGWSAGLELARSDVKKNGSGRTPWTILSDFFANGDTADLRLWREYEQATKGRNAITWTPGLRALLLDAEDVEATDEELAAGPRPGPSAAVVPVPTRVWREWVRTGEWALQLEHLESIWSWCAAMTLGLGWAATLAASRAGPEPPSTE
jgi:hypothetical protein